MPSGLFYFKYLDKSISYIKGVWLVFIIIMFCRNFLLNAKTVDPDQTPRSPASDLGPHILPMSLSLDARLKWVNINLIFVQF